MVQSVGVLAYIDPMSGAIVLQILIAGVIGAGAFFRHSIWAFLRRVFRLRRSTEDSLDKQGKA